MPIDYRVGEEGSKEKEHLASLQTRWNMEASKL